MPNKREAYCDENTHRVSERPNDLTPRARPHARVSALVCLCPFSLDPGGFGTRRVGVRHAGLRRAGSESDIASLAPSPTLSGSRSPRLRASRTATSALVCRPRPERVGFSTCYTGAYLRAEQACVRGMSRYLLLRSGSGSRGVRPQGAHRHVQRLALRRLITRRGGDLCTRGLRCATVRDRFERSPRSSVAVTGPFEPLRSCDARAMLPRFDAASAQDASLPQEHVHGVHHQELPVGDSGSWLAAGDIFRSACSTFRTQPPLSVDPPLPFSHWQELPRHPRAREKSEAGALCQCANRWYPCIYLMYQVSGWVQISPSHTKHEHVCLEVGVQHISLKQDMLAELGSTVLKCLISFLVEHFRRIVAAW